MSQHIAPGKWDAGARKASKLVAFVIGVVLILWSLTQIDRLIDAAREGVPINAWSVALVVLPMVIGGAATFPGVVTPLVYRIIDKLKAE